MTIFGITLSSTDLYLLKIVGALAIIVIGAILYRMNKFSLKRREERTDLINNLLIPFNDAIANIEHGEHNHIMIMNAFYQQQRESITRTKAVAAKRNKGKIDTAWNDYTKFYHNNAEGQITGQFVVFPNNSEASQQKVLRKHLNTIIKQIKKI